MNRSQLLIVSVAILALLGAGAWGFKHWRAGDASGERAFFYDVSKGKLFTAPRTAIAPIRGIDGPELDGVKAVVISITGRPNDRDSHRIAYLEKFSPELKAQMEAAQASGQPLAMSRAATQKQRFVRRLDDKGWFSLDSPEAERLTGEWTKLGKDGVTPVVCIP